MNIASRFQKTAAAAPSNPALSWIGGELSYGELRDLAASVRAALEPAPRIGLLAHRSPVAYAGVLGILSRGATYVPLHPSSPPRHNARILETTGFVTLVVGEECVDALAGLLAESAAPLEIVALDPSERLRSVVEAHPRCTLRSIPRLASAAFEFDEPIDGTAYILFTSGSTGLPKGVRVLHSNVSSYLDSFLRAYPIGPSDRLTQLFDLTFDLSVHDMFVTWSAGATLVSFPDDKEARLLDFARDRKVTVWFSVPAIPTMMDGFGLSKGVELPAIRLSMFCGEKLTWNALQSWRKVATRSRMANLYGPTETTIALTEFEVPEGFGESDCHQSGLPIGRPLHGQKVEIRRPDGSICATGEEGLLWLGGDQVTPGYLDEERTLERFVPRDGEVWYRSGDVGFLGADGAIRYTGREDLQVKLMGYRIELGEIEAALMRATGAPFAIAEVANLRGTVDEVVCVLPKAFSADRKRIREDLKSMLEPYMIPKIWKFQDDLPLNANGKVDRKALKTKWAAEAEAD